MYTVVSQNLKKNKNIPSELVLMPRNLEAVTHPLTSDAMA